jgi:hypothetical protein
MQDRLTDAMAAITGGSSVREAAKNFNILHRTFTVAVLKR